MSGKPTAQDEASACGGAWLDQRVMDTSSTLESLTSVLEIVFDHARNVDVATLGRISCSSKRMGTVVEQALIWRELFEDAVQASVHKYTRPANSTLLSTAGLTRITWGGEDGILPAFADLKLAEEVGFRKAFKCLASHSCEVCQVDISMRCASCVCRCSSRTNAD
jgi:hypothetical protein